LRVRTLLVMAFGLLGSGSRVPPPAGNEIIERLEQRDQWREQALREYRGRRRYQLHSERFGEAARGVEVQYAWPGSKKFQVLWQTGSRTLQTRVLDKVIEAELEAAGQAMRGQTRFHSGNYRFQPLGMDTVNGRTAYVFEMKPRAKKRFLLRGRLWVDAEDAAVVRIDAEPVDTGFWLHNVRIVLEYRKVGPFWMVARQQSRADVRLFGSARLVVEYMDYQVNAQLLAQGAGAQ
jgi:hypothetical protein